MVQVDEHMPSCSYRTLAFAKSTRTGSTYHDHVLGLEWLRRLCLICILPKANDGESRIRITSLIGEIVSEGSRKAVAVDLLRTKHLFPAVDALVLSVKLMLKVEADRVQEYVLL